MLQIFGYISALLSIIMVIPYIYDIFLQKTKPERASWFIWLVLMSIAFFSQYAEGATDSLWLTGGQLVGVLLVFILSIKYGIGGLTKRDISALFFSMIGLLIWFITKNAVYALVIVVIIDAIGIWLTVLKTYEEPGTETLSTWVMSGTASFFGALSIGTFNFILLLYPLYLLLANLSVAGTIVLRRTKK